MRLYIVAKKELYPSLQEILDGLNNLDYAKKVKICRVNARIEITSRFVPTEDVDKELTVALVQVGRVLRPTRTRWDAFVELKR